jgi:CHAT domain-containing protein
MQLRLPRAQLVTDVQTYRTAITSHAPIEVVQSLAERLGDSLLKPALSLIRGERLVIVPHDVLHYVPFAALRTGGRWLVEDYTLATLPSASVLKFLGSKGQGAQRDVLAVGNPDLGPALNLQYGEREARVVAAHYPESTLLIRHDATERRVKELAPDVAILHLATHGTLNETDPLSSALLLGAGQGEDGRLEVREVLGLELHARLVVLSACETGLGKLSTGDDLVGLQRAFMYAGTPAVVTTLWKVDDRASYELMREFYDLVDHQGPGRALAEAQRAILRESPHPFFWAGFSLAGRAD